MFIPKRKPITSNDAFNSGTHQAHAEGAHRAQLGYELKPGEEKFHSDAWLSGFKEACRNRFRGYPRPEIKK